MKKFSFYCFLAMMLVGTIVLNAAEPQTKQGSKALFFGLNGLSEIGFDNSVIGAQYVFQDNMAIWADLGFKSKTEKPSENAQETTHSMVEISAGFLNYIFQKGPVAMYYSPQLGVAFGSDEQGSAKTSTNEFSVGVSLGAEWWMFDGISLTATTFIGYNTLKTTNESGSNKVEATTNSFGILGDTKSKFLISFYF